MNIEWQYIVFWAGKGIPNGDKNFFINSLSLYFYFSQGNNETALKIRYNRCLGVSHQVSYKAVGFVTEHKTWMCNIGDRNHGIRIFP